jgi:hypothetical protein
LLAVVLAFEVPKVMKQGGGSSATSATTTTAAAGTPATASAPATTAPGTAAAAVLPASSGSTTLPSDSAEVPRASKSQLFIFTHFSGKDPFVQQVSDAAATAGSSSGVSSTIPTGTPAPTATASTTAAVHSSGSARMSSARTLAKSGAATISVDGQVQTIRIGASFPSSNPLFRLVSVSRGVARIGISNGSYASGTQTVSLTVGKTLTLVDTTTGAHYKLRLVG